MLVLELPRTARLRVGRLGAFSFPAGHYLYAGSALGGLAGRVGRHLRAGKRRHWHIDYLAGPATVREVWWAEGRTRRECEWFAAAASLPGACLPAPGFGASDCKCVSHLIHAAAPLDAGAFARRLELDGERGMALRRMA